MKNKYQEALDYITPRLKDYRTVKEDRFELHYNNKVSNDYNAVQAIKELIHKETPMKPINKYKIDFGLGDCGGCLKCESLVNYQMAYCPSCGQKIDWGKDND